MAAGCNITRRYLPSELEQQWLDNVGSWQGSFCSVLQQFDPATQQWLAALAVHTQAQQQGASIEGKSPAQVRTRPYSHAPTHTLPQDIRLLLFAGLQVLADNGTIGSSVFSQFVTTYDCGRGSTTEDVTWIEPLSHGLRHPNALCKRGADIMDRGYLLLAHKAEVDAGHRRGGNCTARPCQAIYFDLGATTLVPGTAEAGQGWFFHSYKLQGITFDRFLLWEAVMRTPADVFQHVPKEDMHKYQYYNIPVTPDIKDASNPINILKVCFELAQLSLLWDCACPISLRVYTKH